jgi:hypothetical protein
MESATEWLLGLLLGFCVFVIWVLASVRSVFGTPGLYVVAGATVLAIVIQARRAAGKRGLVGVAVVYALGFAPALVMARLGVKLDLGAIGWLLIAGYFAAITGLWVLGAWLLAPLFKRLERRDDAD